MDLCVYSGHSNMVQFLKQSVINTFALFRMEEIFPASHSAWGVRLTLSASCWWYGGGHATYHSFGVRHCPDDANWGDSTSTKSVAGDAHFSQYNE